MSELLLLELEPVESDWMRKTVEEKGLVEVAWSSLAVVENSTARCVHSSTTACSLREPLHSSDSMLHVDK